MDFRGTIIGKTLAFLSQKWCISDYPFLLRLNATWLKSCLIWKAQGGCVSGQIICSTPWFPSVLWIPGSDVTLFILMTVRKWGINSSWFTGINNLAEIRWAVAQMCRKDTLQDVWKTLSSWRWDPHTSHRWNCQRFLLDGCLGREVWKKWGVRTHLERMVQPPRLSGATESFSTTPENVWNSLSCLSKNSECSKAPLLMHTKTWWVTLDHTQCSCVMHLCSMLALWAF